MELDFESCSGASSGASRSFPMQCSALRKNGHVLLKGRACKIVEMTTSKTGKHGHAKVHLVGLDLFNGKKIEDLCPSTHNMEVPVVNRLDYVLLDIESDGYVSLMLEDGSRREDLKLPQDPLGAEIQSGFDNGTVCMVTVLKAMGEEQIVGMKGTK